MQLDDPEIAEKLTKLIMRYMYPSKVPTYLGQIWQQNNIFVGRIKEMQEVEDILLQKNKVLLMNGIGGIGKTSLAYQIMKREPCLYEHIIWTNCEKTLEDSQSVFLNTILYDSSQLHEDLDIVERLREAKTETGKWNICLLYTSDAADDW